MDIGYRVRKGYRGATEVTIHQKTALNTTAALAVTMIERWGMAASMEDGETSTGEYRLRLLTPDELVARACETAEKVTAEIRRRGWILDLPEPSIEQVE